MHVAVHQVLHAVAGDFELLGVRIGLVQRAAHLRHHVLQAPQVSAEILRRALLDFAAGAFAFGVALGEEPASHGGVRRAVHPGKLRQRLRALPCAFRQESGLRKGEIEELADRQDLGKRLAVGDQHRYLRVGVERQVLGRALLAAVQLDELRLEGRFGGLEANVGHEGAGAGGPEQCQHW